MVDYGANGMGESRSANVKKMTLGAKRENV